MSRRSDVAARTALNADFTSPRADTAPCHWARSLLFAALVVTLSACLPPERSNVPIDTASLGADAGADVGADSDDGAGAADGAPGDDTSDSVDGGDAATVTDAGADAVALPKGCTSDSACAPLAFGECQSASCDTKTGLCSVEAVKNGSACTAASACVDNATCKAGVCSGTLKTCSDNDPCTIDGCDPLKGCTAVVAPLICDDANPCTFDDRCVDGACKGKAKDCAVEASACETATCNVQTGDCNKKPAAKGTSCDDGNACTKGDSCAGLQCEGTVDCDDGDACTEDFCPPGGLMGCVHLTLQGQASGCTDSDPCVVATCIGGKCDKSPKSCDDKDECTADACQPDGSCKQTKLVAGPCSDGDPCTTGDECNKGQCKATGTLSCDDGNGCTEDSCVAFNGCAHTFSGKVCNDGSACTSSDVCNKGKCSGTPKECVDGEACTLDGCDPLKGSCVFTAVVDGASCPTGTCKAGACGGGGG